MVRCPYCGAIMRSTMLVGAEPKQPDGWKCDRCTMGADHDNHVGQQIVGSLKTLGWNAPCGTDPNTGQRLTMIDMHLRYHQAMIVINEVEARCTKENK